MSALSHKELREIIQAALGSFTALPLSAAAKNLFGVLGYTSPRDESILRISTVDDFLGWLAGAGKLDLLSAKDQNDLCSVLTGLHFLFQLTDDEIKAAIDPTQASLFDSGTTVDGSRIHSYLIFAAQLAADAPHTRTALVRLVRLINKPLPMPALILFRQDDLLTLAVINRRLHKREQAKDVLEKVTLIKDINCRAPHRAHREILGDLALLQLHRKYGFTNFVELHQAWQKTLDTTELNERFFQDIANWYLWAIKTVKYPNPHHLTEQHNHSLNVIRLLTRLIFCWFLKEKKLLPEALFDPAELAKILVKSPLKQGDGDQSSYYKAILQNLFFATLNTDMNKDVPGSRRFITDRKSAAGVSEGYSVPTVLRYKQLFQEKEKAICHFEDIPFLNGGLFECLDTFETVDGRNVETRIDGFSSTFSKQPVVPDELFFSEETIIDLSGDSGSPKYANTKVKGLICILEKYKFTIEENTPVEEEIALDPELLGKVFENLLANYNPGAQITARKQTGSFYTPREIVNYMVDESLLRYLEDRLIDFHKAGGNGNPSRAPINISVQKSGQLNPKEKKTLHDKLRHLLAYTEEGHLFKDGKGEDTSQVDALIDAVNDCKILDPACGSGAFPMGILHKMVFILAKLDPFNTKWKQVQLDKAGRDRERAEKMEDEEIRRHTLENIEQRIQAIEEAFGSNRHELDYTRKLFLIENCIYGVDIQNIAVQIAKLRFFISLVVDQKVMDDHPNRNILALPNLETKFVAANTLIGIDKPKKLQELQLGSDKVYAVEDELKSLRQKLFYTRKYTEKKKLRQAEKAKREELKMALIESHYSTQSAGMIAGWNPFDPVQAAEFFDIETMFNLQDGFDVVIGNPPYARVQTLQQTQPASVAYFKKHYLSAKGSFDIYILFVEKGFQLLQHRGILSYILPHKFFQAKFGEPIRRFLSREKSLYQVVRFGAEQVFEESSTYTCLLFLTRNPNDSLDLFEVKSLENPVEILAAIQIGMQQPGYQKAVIPAPKDSEWIFTTDHTAAILQKLKQQSHTLGDITRKIFQGIATSADNIYVLKMREWKAATVRCFSPVLKREVEIERGLVKPFLMGKNVHRYQPPTPENVVVFPYNIVDGRATLMTPECIKKHFPLGWQYLLENREALEGRERGRFKEDWYAFSRPQNMTEFAAVKLMTPEIARGGQMTLDEKGEMYHTTKVYSFVFSINVKDNLKYFLGVLNSKILWFFLSSTGYVLRGGYFTFKTDYLNPFPIPCSLSKNPPTKAQHDLIVRFVEQILAAKRHNPDAFTLPLEAQIDGLVAHLYSLTEEEFSLILAQLSLPDPERVAAANAYRDIERGLIK
ncbi:MAG: Eco57I restriction-modification methylase domain-containing protein [Syntrophales bacterium]|nr:Eco57I restriction-modification methylase domain-containing protein [Syntrophales bacterium]